MNLGPLVASATLVDHLGDPDWRVVDVRHQLADPGYGEQAWASSHLPGAVFLHCDRDLSGPLTGRNGRHPLPDPGRLATRLGQAGIGPRATVVVYDDAQGMIAGRLWWLLRALGHPRVALLDGGWQAWLAAGGPLTSEPPAVVPTEFAVPGRELAFAGVATADDLLHPPTVPRCLIDARSPDRFRGENETLDPVGGRLPTAVNRFFRDNCQPDGCFKSPAVLRDEWQTLLGTTAPAASVHYCGSGVSACLNLVAMAVAGLPPGQLYAGSWSEWCSDPSRPMASGPAA